MIVKRVLRAVAAAAAILGILFALPVALWVLGRPLLPTSIPTWAEVVAALSRPDNGDLLLGFIVLVGASAWLLLALSILAELASVALRRPVLRINLPGFRLSRGIAAALVAALLGLGATPAFAAPAAAIPAVTATTPVDPAVVLANQLLPLPGTGGPDDIPVYRVEANDTLSAVAGHELDDPTRWPEIFTLNADRAQPDGKRLVDPDLIRPGWLLELPPDRPTLDPEPTAGSEPPQDGTATTPPTTPPPTSAPTETLDPAPPPPARPSEPSPTTTTAPAPEAAGPPTPDDRVPDAVGQPADGTGSTVNDQDSTDVDAAAAVTGVVSTVLVGGLVTALLARRHRQRRHRLPGHRVAAPSDAAGRIEWEALHHGSDQSAPVAPGPVVVLPDDAALLASPAGLPRTTGAEQPLRRLDRALRGLTLSDWQDSPPPDLRTVELATSTVTLSLAGAAMLPEPFAPSDRADRWLLAADAELEVSDAEAAGFCAPFPLLASVATSPADPNTESAGPAGDHVLFVDLEQTGVTRIHGPAGQVDGLVRHLVAELANAPWADDVDILLTDTDTSGRSAGPAAADLVALNPHRVRAADLATGLMELRARMHHTRAALDASLGDAGSVLHARLRNAFPLDAWLPTVLIIRGTPDPTNSAALDDLVQELTTSERQAAAIIIASDDPAIPATLPAASITLTDDGELHTGGTLADTDTASAATRRLWRSQHLDPTAAGHLVDLLAATDQPDTPAGPAQDNQPWAHDMTEDGRHHPPTPDDQHAPPVTPPDQHDHIPIDLHEDPDDDLDDDLDDGSDDDQDAPQPRNNSVLPRPAVEGPSAQHDAHADPEALRLLEIVHRQDPDLDDDLARWRADDPPIPLIAVLGIPEVRAPGIRPSTRVSWFVEVLVYLCLHPAGVSVEQALTDLWPQSRTIQPSTVRHAFYGARRWAGAPTDAETGQPGPTYVSDMLGSDLYRIHGHLLDWDLFRRLRKRAQARHNAGHPGAVSDYRAALDLVRGPILSGLRPRGYAWLNNHHQRHDLQIPGFIADTAHELVDIALTPPHRDLALARWAAETARSIDIDGVFDDPLTDLMRIADAEGNTAELERYAAILLDSRDTDVPEDLPPRTFAVLDRLLPDGPRRVRPHTPP